MRRKEFLHTLVTGAAVLPYTRWLTQSGTSMDFRFEYLRSNLGFFTERGGTIGWLMENDGIVVVDAQFPEQAGHFLNALRKESQAGIHYLINTHHHGDHTSGNIAFRDETQTILAHENSVKNQRKSAQTNQTEEQQLFPNLTYTTHWSARVGDEFVKVDYAGPAHTDGDSIIHFTNANVVHIGDLVFNRRHPYIDKDAGASIENWINVLNNACTHFDNDTLFLFGHAREGYDIKGGKAELKAFAHYLERVLDHVALLLRNGKSEDEILAVSEIPGAEDWRGEGIQRSLRAAMIELNAGR